MSTRGRYARDLAERVFATYCQAFLGLWIASGVGMEFVTDLSNADKALVSVLPALLSVVKGLVAKGVGDPDSASLADVPPPNGSAPRPAHRDTGRAALSLLTVVTLIVALLAVFAGPAAAAGRCSAPAGTRWQVPC